MTLCCACICLGGMLCTCAPAATQQICLTLCSWVLLDSHLLCLWRVFDSQLLGLRTKHKAAQRCANSCL